jgi:transposase
MVAYKAELVGIRVVLTEERYTSKASFLDADPLPIYGSQETTPVFSGKRVKRGLYRAADGWHINADVNGAYNILRNALPDAFSKGIAGATVHPVRLPVRTKRVAYLSLFSIQ